MQITMAASAWMAADTEAAWGADGAWGADADAIAAAIGGCPDVCAAIAREASGEDAGDATGDIADPRIAAMLSEHGADWK